MIQMDLESFCHIKEISNSTNIRDIETRLPDNVKKDWARIVVRETLEDSSLMHKYRMCMNLLSVEKV